jgi:hypothetical protein
MNHHRCMRDIPASEVAAIALDALGKVGGLAEAPRPGEFRQ